VSELQQWWECCHIRERAAALVAVLAHLALQVIVGFIRMCEHGAELGEGRLLLLQTILHSIHGMFHNMQISWAAGSRACCHPAATSTWVQTRLKTVHLLRQSNGCNPRHP
jgi:hypothetical protein